MKCGATQIPGPDIWWYSGSGIWYLTVHLFWEVALRHRTLKLQALSQYGDQRENQKKIPERY